MKRTSNITFRISGCLLTLASALCAVSCIHNDIPYPVVECRIESIAAEGLASAPVIDHTRGQVTLPLLETTDIRNVNITDVALTDKAQASQEIVGRHDLTTPFTVVLSLYADYEWQISAEQTITRNFTVEGQVGAAEWDLQQRTAKVYVGRRAEDDPEAVNPSSVVVTSLKLGPEGITRMSVPAENIEDFDSRDPLQGWDFTTYRNVAVEYHGRTEVWTLYVEYTDIKVDFKRIDAWVRTAWFYGEGLSGTDLGFRYRPAGSGEWTTVEASDLIIDGGSFSTRLKGLSPESDYEAIAYSGNDESAVMTFRTEPELPLPNGDFETWSKIGSLVCPYLSTDEMFWDTGNKGAATANETLTEGASDVRPGSPGTTSARLTSKFANVVGLGKFAAGNIFLGKYVETVGTNGKINFGRPFTSHPTALRGWVRFTNGKINRIGNQPQGRTLTTDDFDEGMIYVAMGTWTPEEYGGSEESPVMVFSKEESTFFNKNADAVIGYGELVLERPTDGWQEFTIPIDYKSTDTAPTHIVIVCSASRWGDYFTGSDQNIMWLDDFELLWE